MAQPIGRSTKAPQLLILTANTNDRFGLLDDGTVPEPNLDNPIHSIFRRSNFSVGEGMYRNLQRALQLASMFLQDDSVLEWFVAPLLGIPLLDVQSGKNYLSDPLANKSALERQRLIQRVRRALECLSHSIYFSFIWDPETRINCYARTKILHQRPNHTPTCTQHFKHKESLLVEFRSQFWDFLQNHYTSVSRCERIRFDFSLASAFLHELSHSIGVMRRGDLTEPHVRLDHFQAELGYAWENFMFGGIINPLDRASTRISFLTRKIWSDDASAYVAGGKEWATVPMSYIAQWFQKDTWVRIGRDGPTAVPPPTVHLKLRAVASHYTILCDNKASLTDIGALQLSLIEMYRPTGRYPSRVVPFITSKLKQRPTEELQTYLLPEPSRTTVRLSVAAKPISATGEMMVRSYSNPLPAARPGIDTKPRSGMLLKRSADSDEDSASGKASNERPRKRVKSSSERLE